jgi:hypothetical protein
VALAFRCASSFKRRPTNRRSQGRNCDGRYYAATTDTSRPWLFVREALFAQLADQVREYEIGNRRELGTLTVGSRERGR